MNTVYFLLSFCGLGLTILEGASDQGTEGASVGQFWPFWADFSFNVMCLFQNQAVTQVLTKICNKRPIHLYLIFEKSSSTNCIFNLQKSTSKLIFAGFTGSRNRLKIQFVELDFSKLIFQKSSRDPFC